MNIFILDNDMKQNVKFYTNKHIVKMITESVQLLSFVNRLNGLEQGYKLSKTHKNHPCTKWCGESLSNWKYLYNLVFHMHDEYLYRYPKKDGIKHKAFEIMLTLSEPNIKDVGLTEFVQCMPDQYKCDNAVQAYRNYYLGDKVHLFKWKNREIPYWIN